MCRRNGCARDDPLIRLTLVRLCFYLFRFRHDFMNMADLGQIDPNQDWSICMDGTKNEGAVRGAVQDFAAQKGLVLSVMYKEQGIWASWMVQKPTIPECVF
jgi:hypothetical protein